MGYKHILHFTCCLSLYISTDIRRNRLWCLGIRGISLLGLSVYLYTRTQRKQVVVSGYPGYQQAAGYPGYQPAVLSIYIYKRIQRNRWWYLGIQSISLLGLSVYIYTHILRDTQWYLSSPYISINAYRETGCGIWVSKVSVCCPPRIYLYAHTEKQVVVSGYLGYQPAVLSVYVYYTHSVYLYTRTQRNRLWYLGIQDISLQSTPYISIDTYRETSDGIWVSSV